jgi:type I restriction enzyme S subunit
VRNIVVDIDKRTNDSDADLPTGFKMTELGPLPEEWEVVRLREVAEYMKAGGTPKTSEASFWSGKIPFVKVEDVAKPGIYLIGTTSYITEQGLKNSNTWLVPKNSILLSMYGTAGEVKITGREVAISQNVLGIIPNENVFLVEFAYYALLWARNYTLHLITDVTIFKHFTLAKAKQLVLPLPPLHEQRAIARVLRTVDKKLQAEEARKQALEELFKTLLHNLMTGEIRVKDVVLPNVGEGKGDITN